MSEKKVKYPKGTTFKARQKKQPRQKASFLLVILILLSMTIVAYITMPAKSYQMIVSSITYPLDNLPLLLGSPLKTSSSNRTNFLLLGAGGKNHEGGYLTDTILVLSFDNKNKNISMISIPRDVFLNVPGLGDAKINDVFEISKKKYKKEKQFIPIKAAAEEILDIPIHYAGLIDFTGFAELIDAVDGVQVDIENTFTDHQYPAPNHAFQTVHFSSGTYTLHGKKALQFARSRHADEYYERGDFSRAKRQQKIITALREKLFSLGVLASPRKINKLYKSISQNIRTDISLRELITTASLIKQMSKGHIYSLVLDDGPSGLLYAPMASIRNKYYGGAYVLLPDGGNFDSIHQLVKNFLQTPSKIAESAKIEILNGTNQIGLANRFSTPLKAKGFKIANIANTHRNKHYKKSLIIIRQPDTYLETEKILATLLPNAEITTDNTEPSFSNADFTIVLGSEYGNKFIDQEAPYQLK